MLFLAFFTVFTSLAASVPLDSAPPSKYPSIDTLNKFATLLGSLADEIGNWNGAPNGMNNIVQHSRQTIDTLHAAIDQIYTGEPLDYLTVLFSFAPVGININSKAHSLANSLQSKLTKFKSLNQEETMYHLLDDAYTETTSFFNVTSPKMPPFIYSVMKPFHTELLGTLAVARESFRPSQEVIVVIMENNTPGAPPITYTLPPGSPRPTGKLMLPPSYEYQPPAQCVQPAPYAQYTPQYTQPIQDGYAAYTPRLPSAPYPTQYRGQ
jgi:hypothetical protein